MDTNEVIDLQYGSGGEMTGKLLDQVIFRYLQNEVLDQRHDGALLHANGPIAFSTDSYVISPLFFKGGNIGELAVNGTVNDLAMCGAIPRYLSLAFIIEEGFEMNRLITIVQSIRKAADGAGVWIVTGDTKVVERGKGDGLYINTSGIGTLHPKANIHTANIQIGDALLINSCLASHGMAIMSQREGLAFQTELVSDTTPLNHLVAELLDCFGTDIHFMRDATRGGLASILHEITAATNIGIAIRGSVLPVLPDVASACELLGLDPLYVANEGVFACIVPDRIKADVLSVMQRYNPHARYIGTITTDHPGKIISESAFGGRHVVHPLVGEQLPRIC